jgi:hypothetical protein
MQAPLNLVEFVVDRFLALDVLAVQPFDRHCQVGEPGR